MTRLLLAAATLAAICGTLVGSSSLPASRHLEASSSSQSSAPGLSGRFLHVTDFHIDPHYKPGTAISAGCHSQKPHKEHPRAGYWGSAVSGCDSPPHLVQETVAWIQRNWLPQTKSELKTPSDQDDGRAQFDFIVWTGDSARHDIDNKYPRTRQEIYDLNRWALSLLQQTFPGTPIVPTIGNNDIFPHNIMWPGPNDVISAFTDIWSDIIPEFQLHTFQLGGYFTKEVIPNKLAIISTNSMYWYDSNKVAEGCKKSKKRRRRKSRSKKRKGKKGKLLEESETEEDGEYEWIDESSEYSSHDIFEALKTKDPGTVQLEWLEAQLYQFRKRGMAVHIMGHVPPTAGNYFSNCYDVYSDTVLHYQETVLAQHFGHMNVDAFFIQEDTGAVKRENKKADRGLEIAQQSHLEQTFESADDGEGRVVEPINSTLPVVSLINAQALSDDLRKDYAILPSAERTNDSYYHYFFVAPSVIPTFLPGVRVWTYNVSGVDISHDREDVQGYDSTSNEDLEQSEEQEGSLFKQHADSQMVFKAPRSVNDDSPSSMSRLLSLFPDFDPTRLLDPFISLRRSHRRPKHGKKRKRRSRRLPRYASPTSPSRVNGPLSLLGYSQWILDLDGANKKHEQAMMDKKQKHEHQTLDFRLEYATYTPATLWSNAVAGDKKQSESAAASHSPVPRHLLLQELDLRNISRSALRHGLLSDGDVNELQKKHIPRELKHLTDWNLEHITIPTMMDLARRLASDNGLWKRYRRRVYEGSGAES